MYILKTCLLSYFSLTFRLNNTTQLRCWAVSTLLRKQKSYAYCETPTRSAIQRRVALSACIKTTDIPSSIGRVNENET